MIFAAAHDSLPPQQDRDVHAQFRRDLGVDGWDTPLGARYRIEHEPGAPAWWLGDEEASQSWLSAAGVDLG